MKSGRVHYIRGKKCSYISMFDEDSGAYLRTGMLKGGKNTGLDAFMADFPELLVVGIMGNCIHGNSGLCQKAGIDCYQGGSRIHQAHMSFGDYKRIVKE